MSASDLKMRVTNLGRQVRAELSVQQREWFDEFVEAGERVLAAEMLADWLSEDEIPISASFRSEALLLARDMGIEERISRVLEFCPNSPEGE